MRAVRDEGRCAERLAGIETNPQVQATVHLDQVLMVADGEAVKVGTPTLAGAKVSATKSGWNRATPPGAVCSNPVAMAAWRSARAAM